ERGDAQQAAAMARESLGLLRSSGSRWYVAEALELLGAVASLRGQAQDAARLWGTAEALREATGAPIPRSNRNLYERSLANARAALDQAAFAAAWAEGRRLTLEQAIDEALASEGTGTAAEPAP